MTDVIDRMVNEVITIDRINHIKCEISAVGRPKMDVSSYCHFAQFAPLESWVCFFLSIVADGDS